MAEEHPDDSERFTQRAAIFLVIVLSLRHPLQALGELFRMIFRTVGRALGRVLAFALTPVFRLGIWVASRNDSKRPSFEEYLRRSDEEPPTR